MLDLSRKSLEPIVLTGGVAVRTLQELLSPLPWDHAAAQRLLVRQVTQRLSYRCRSSGPHARSPAGSLPKLRLSVRTNHKYAKWL